jgi:hypothetical protein
MMDEPSDEKKQATIDFVKWVRTLVPSLPETASAQEYWDQMTGTQRRRMMKRLQDLNAME